MKEDTSGTNTLLLIIILVVVVAGGVWLFKGGFSPAAPAEDDSASIEVNIPTPDAGGNEGGEAQPQ